MFFSDPNLAVLDLHAVKGQTIRVQRPDSVDFSSMPPVSGARYVIPEGDSLAIGSSFEHQFDHELVDLAVSWELRFVAAAMIPELKSSKIIEERVGIRVTVPKIRLPMVGPMPGHSRIWVFTAFGSKGLLLAPLLARELAEFVEDPGRIPDEIRVRTKG